MTSIRVQMEPDGAQTALCSLICEIIDNQHAFSLTFPESDTAQLTYGPEAAFAVDPWHAWAVKQGFAE